MGRDLRNKTVLVTGGAGMMGRPLVDLLLADGANVRVLDKIERPRDLDSSVGYWTADLGKAGELVGMVEWAYYIFHLAGAKGGVGIGRKRGADFLVANMRSTMNLLDAIRRAEARPRVVFVSSVGAYSGEKNVFREDQAMEGQPHASDYYGGHAKRFGEILCQAYREQFGLDYVVVRPTSTFGPHDRFDAETGMVIPSLIKRLEDGERPLVLRGNGNTMRDFLYSEDCAAGILAAMKRGRSGEIYNLGTGCPKAVSYVAECLAKLYGTTVELEPTVDNSPWMRCMDTAKSERELGFKAQWKIEKALKRTVEWYRANKEEKKYDPFKD